MPRPLQSIIVASLLLLPFAVGLRLPFPAVASLLLLPSVVLLLLFMLAVEALLPLVVVALPLQYLQSADEAPALPHPNAVAPLLLYRLFPVEGPGSLLSPVVVSLPCLPSAVEVPSRLSAVMTSLRHRLSAVEALLSRLCPVVEPLHHLQSAVEALCLLFLDVVPLHYLLWVAAEILYPLLLVAVPLLCLPSVVDAPHLRTDVVQLPTLLVLGNLDRLLCLHHVAVVSVLLHHVRPEKAQGSDLLVTLAQLRRGKDILLTRIRDLLRQSGLERGIAGVRARGVEARGA